MRKAFVLTACLIVVIVVISLIISITNLKPFSAPVFKTVVTYSEETYTIVEAPKYEASTSSKNDFAPITNLLKYEKTVMVSTLVLGLIFVILFYATKRSKGW